MNADERARKAARDAEIERLMQRNEDLTAMATECARLSEAVMGVHEGQTIDPVETLAIAKRLRGDLDRAREALTDYGQHGPSCPQVGSDPLRKCDCGWEEIQSALSATKEPQ